MGDITVHASVARVGNRGVLIRGASGSGKSALLMGLLVSRDADAMLVADDRAILAVEDGRLVASVPPSLAGLMEIRGVGVVRREYLPATRVDLVVDLKPLAECPRHPAGEDAFVELAGVHLPRIFIAIGAHDGVARVIAALASADRRILT
jgi:serine kinase of HPr protein (carbohydrate metabolism regulator)